VSAASTPWPIGEKDGQRALVVYRNLERAMRANEDAEAIAAAWGVEIATVTEWRTSLGVVSFAERRANHRGRLPRFTMETTRMPEPSRPVLLHPSSNQRPKGHHWTPEEDELVRRLPVKEVMIKLGVSQAAVCKRRKLIGVGLHELAKAK
jgi:hypothetical protein